MEIQKVRELLAAIQRNDWTEVMKIAKKARKTERARQHHSIPPWRNESAILNKSSASPSDQWQ